MKLKIISIFVVVIISIIIFLIMNLRSAKRGVYD